jgi:hypothetical protein
MCRGGQTSNLDNLRHRAVVLHEGQRSERNIQDLRQHLERFVRGSPPAIDGLSVVPDDGQLPPAVLEVLHEANLRRI